MAFNIKKLGWIPDSPDHRDRRYSAPYTILSALPEKVDLSTHPAMPPIYNQYDLGSCTANAIGATVQFERRQAGKTPDFIPSRLFIYYNERVMENTVSVDSGAQLRDGIKSIAIQGVCSEDLWPYDISKFASKPSTKCYSAAKSYTAIQYSRVSRRLADMRACLASGNLIVFGFAVFGSFMTEEVATTGRARLPDPNEAPEGGHAVVAVGYDNPNKVFIVRNSWGSEWGVNGYFYLPYDFLLRSDLSADFWTVSMIRG